MIRSKNVYRSAAAASALLIGGVAQAAAQGESAAASAEASNADEERGLVDIVVTAERREGALQRVPIAVSAISPETLENVQITETQDLQKIVPGLRMTYNIASPSNFTIALRGSVQQDSSLIVTESPVGIYVDDIYIARLNGANAQLADLERVEVLRGPQGTLYGRNTLSGAMKFISRTPGNQPWTDLSAEYGSYNTFRATGSVGGPLVEDVYGSLSLLYNGTSGYYRNIATNDDFGRERNFAARGRIRFTPGGWDITASLSYARSVNQAQVLTPGVAPTTPQFTSDQIVPLLADAYTVSVPRGTGRANYLTDYPRGVTTQVIGSVNASYDLDWATFRSISGYVHTEDLFSPDLSGLGFIPIASRVESDVFTQELQLLGSAFEDRLDWLLGVYYFREKANQELRLLTSVLTEIKTDSIAAFGHGTFRFSDSLSLTAGLRWTQDNKRFTGGIRALDFPFPDVDFSSRNTYRSVTPKASLNYQLPASGDFLSSLLVYASVARGFKSGGYNGVPVISPGVLQTVYGPETNWTYEAGVKADLFDRHLRINAAYFINRISGLTANATIDVGGTLIFPVTNVGDATVRGLELEITAIPIQGLNIFTNATFQAGRYRDIIADSAPAIALATFGRADLPQLSDYSFTAGFDYTVDFRLGNSRAELKFGGDWYRTGDYFASVNNDYLTVITSDILY